MKKKFLNFAVTFIQKYKNYDEKELEKLRYGLEGLYLTLTKLVVIVLAALVLGIWKQVFLLLIFFNIIRYTGFGFHADKSYQCLILSVFYFILIPEFYLHFSLSNLFQLGICLLCIFCYLLYAPADTVKRPLPNKKKRIVRKLTTVLIGIIYSILLFLFPNSIISAPLLSALTVQAIIIQPWFYKLFGQPFNNYKTYHKGSNTNRI